MRLRDVVDYLYLFQTLIPMPVQSPLPATKMLQPIRAPLFLDRSKMRLFNTMTINKIRCFNCGNLFRVDLDRPEKTGMAQIRTGFHLRRVYVCPVQGRLSNRLTTKIAPRVSPTRSFLPPACVLVLDSPLCR